MAIEGTDPRKGHDARKDTKNKVCRTEGGIGHKKGHKEGKDNMKEGTQNIWDTKKEGKERWRKGRNEGRVMTQGRKGENDKRDTRNEPGEEQGERMAQ